MEHDQGLNMNNFLFSINMISSILVSKRTLIFLSFLTIFSLKSSNAQEVGSWWMYFGSNRLHDNWSLWTEAQYRSHDHGENVEQLLLRTAIQWHATKRSFFALGYGYIGNYIPETDIQNPTIEEGRIFQQYILKHNWSRTIFEHRFRLEQRWIQGEYANRFRYRLFLIIPLGKKKLEEDTWFIGLYDEIFLNTVEKYYDRNRLYGAIGYQFNSTTNLQVGMLNQDSELINKWYFQLALIWNPDFRKEQEVNK